MIATSASPTPESCSVAGAAASLNLTLLRALAQPLASEKASGLKELAVLNEVDPAARRKGDFVTRTARRARRMQRRRRSSARTWRPLRRNASLASANGTSLRRAPASPGSRAPGASGPAAGAASAACSWAIGHLNVSQPVVRRRPRRAAASRTPARRRAGCEASPAWSPPSAAGSPPGGIMTAARSGFNPPRQGLRRRSWLRRRPPSPKATAKSPPGNRQR